IYTGRYGHQGLRKMERATIQFAGEPSVELDFSGLHIRMLYHREGMKYDGDPYALWGEATTRQLRLLAKTAVNALINAKDTGRAVRACNYALQPVDKDGNRKTGKDLREADRLHRASRKTGLTFAAVADLAVEHHWKVRHLFGKDMGVKLMPKDSQIA